MSKTLEMKLKRVERGSTPTPKQALVAFEHIGQHFVLRLQVVDDRREGGELLSFASEMSRWRTVRLRSGTV